MGDPEVIYLEPGPDFCPNVGRQWCEDDVWPLEGDGPGGIRYVRADAIETLTARLAEAEEALRGNAGFIKAQAEERARIEAELPVWQDIASAPRDGTKFDVWVPDAFGGRRMCGLSFNAKGQLRQHGLLTEADLPRWPTHWMPLPAAPNQRGE